MNKDQIIELARKADARLEKINASMDWEKITEKSIDKLFNFGWIEVGWRESCGKTDNTQKQYREFRKLIDKMVKSGYQITEKRIKHPNALATKSGGFWSSIIFRLITEKG